jgi:hypothetical protein
MHVSLLKEGENEIQILFKGNPGFQKIKINKNKYIYMMQK